MAHEDFHFIAAILLAPAHLLAQPSPEAISEASYAGGPLPEGQSAITVVVQILSRPRRDQPRS